MKRSAVPFAPEICAETYRNAWDGNPTWNAIPVAGGALYPWQETFSTYIQEPPFFIGLTPAPGAISEIHGARVLAMLGDSVTTDHISPAGDIPADGPAGRFLGDHGADQEGFQFLRLAARQ